MTSIPPPIWPESVAPPLERPELPAGAPVPTGRPPWRPWTGVLALIAGFVGATVAALIIGVVAAIGGADIANPPAGVNILATLAQDVCLVLAALFFARTSRPPSPEQFGLRRVRIKPALAAIVLGYVGLLAFAALWSAALNLHETDKLPDELGVDRSTAALVAVSFLVAVVAPLCEELFFRGYFFTALRNWRGLWPAAILTGLVFGAVHAGSSPVGFLVPLAFFGFILCLIYARTGSLYPCIALHCVNNSIAFGNAEHWSWQIPVLAVGSLAFLTLVLATVRRTWGPAPAPAA